MSLTINNTHNIEWADPTGKRAARNIALAAAIALYGPKLDLIESYVQEHPGTGHSAIAKALHVPRRKVIGALECLIELGRVRLVGGFYA